MHPGIQGWFNTQKSINGIPYTRGLKKSYDCMNGYRKYI